MSVSICFIFEAQILILLFAYGMKFFQEFAYVFDLVVVTGAIYIEMEPSGMFTGGSLLAILLGWRVLRVVHGLATSMELHHKRSHEKMKGERQSMLEMIVATRRKGNEKRLYFSEYNDKLLGMGVELPDAVDHKGEEKEEDVVQPFDEHTVHTANGSALETAMHFRAAGGGGGGGGPARGAGGPIELVVGLQHRQLRVHAE